MAIDIQTLTQGLSPFILWPTLAITSTVLYLLLTALYNLTLHPLRSYPGPRLWAATRLPYAAMLLRGDPHKTILALHQRYGPVVRVAPAELSFQSPEAWRDVMGHRKGAKSEENAKLPIFIEEKHADIISSNREDHARYRRILSHGFSAKSMQEQQPIIKSYIDLLIDRLHTVSAENKPVDVVAWYNYTTFDIIGDLAFGESFGCLDSSDYHPWVKLIFDDIKLGMYFYVAKFFRALEPLLKNFVPKSLVAKRAAHKQLVKERVESRIAMGTPRPDFAESMLKKTGVESLTKDELYENSNVLIIAGSETTATALSGATYLLTSSPDKLARLTAEVRGAFGSADEIDILGTARLEYLQAVLEETLRCYPPVPSALPRVTPAAGQEICGKWVPGNTTLGIWHWPMYHNEANFARPFEFLPERWLGDPEFKDDRLDALKPFHFGPRNCLGMNLAYAEMRMMLSRMVWHFDMELSPESKGWLDHPVYTLWNKPPLKVHLTPRKDI
ncbi:trichothecene c-15 hydroxylase [Colletotrichum plurivorum]|uniref:Trichothecene c-15 hydroxylase n=1 Tax=Colletotrichum plurivorum TaxID=2175906 RepID=A0A8H6K174_9PEZI|nr:trichothecene c-15 hydroxylase [Colletotrichum plurivorum]